MCPRSPTRSRVLTYPEKFLDPPLYIYIYIYIYIYVYIYIFVSIYSSIDIEEWATRQGQIFRTWRNYEYNFVYTKTIRLLLLYIYIYIFNTSRARKKPLFYTYLILFGLNKFTILVTETVKTDHCLDEKPIGTHNYLVYNCTEWKKMRIPNKGQN